MNMKYEELLLIFARKICWLCIILDWWLFGLAYLMKHCWVMYWQVGSDRQRVMPVYLSVISDEACFGLVYVGLGSAVGHSNVRDYL